jgi:prepilin peptidase dependent protein B
MLARQQGFSLLETLLAMAIGSVILLAAARFLPALQFAVLQQTLHQTLEDELWQRLYTLPDTFSVPGIAMVNVQDNR